jgi:HK97 family phage major capsid protein
MTIKELRQQKADLKTNARALLDKAEQENRDLTEPERVEFDKAHEDLERVETNIVRYEKQLEAERRGGSRGDEIVREDPRNKGFESFGEQLMAVARAERQPQAIDPRLFAAPSGLGETYPSEGGYLVQPEYGAELMRRTYELGEILNRCKKIPSGGRSNRITFTTIDETSRATGSRWGGVRVYRAAEADALTATKPKYGQMALEAKKLIGLVYATDELLADAPALQATINEAFPEEFIFKIEDEIIRGDGAGKMLGILNANCLVTVAKETGQLANTIVNDNITKMWSRCWGRSRKNAVWLINQDVEPQLLGMGITVGTGGSPVYMPPGGLSQSPYSTLMGRPVIPVEYCETLGTVGDIILADFSQYLIYEKATLQSASSMHVRFLNDEMTFRFTLRNDGQPKWKAALIPFKGSNTLSPFVVLATRA